MIRLGPLLEANAGGLAAQVGAGSDDLPVPSDESGLRRSRPHKWGRWIGLVLALVLAGLIAQEVRSSWLQAHLLSSAAEKMTYRIVEGGGLPTAPSKSGPYDERLGYSILPTAVESLQRAGYRVTAHTRLSPWQDRAVFWGGTPIYDEKIRAGLKLTDQHGRVLYESITPRDVYPNYAAIPQLVVRTLLFAENRQILETSLPYRNPTVEWTRISRAVFDVGWNKVDHDHPVSGGSTVATQLEKLRHSPGGRTLSPVEKLRQMLSSSLRSYRNGPRNLEAREEVVGDYINSLPLAATTDQGEILGLIDGLRAWFGADPVRANQLLNLSEEEAEAKGVYVERALAYRQTTMLLLAAKKPSTYLVEDRNALRLRVDTYLGLLQNAGVISERLRLEALNAPVAFRHVAASGVTPTTAARKGIDSVRSSLAWLAGVSGLYALDRLDLSADTTLDGPASEGVARVLTSISLPDGAAAAGMLGKSMLAADDTSGVIYSFTLYEHKGNANLLRVQTDNYPQPLNLNQGSKLELGSTAKLRTLAHYLEIVSSLYDKYSRRPPDDLRAIEVAPEDALSAWAIDYLSTNGDAGLPKMLEAALDRKYSASPYEGFYTGGGVHTFSNFDGSDNGRLLTVREALHRSVNLVFIRVMRDLVRYHIAQYPETYAVLDAPYGDPLRKKYLDRFVDQESREFLSRFYRKYITDPQGQAQALLAGEAHRPSRFAAAYRTMKPDESFEAFETATEGLDVPIKASDLEHYYTEFAPGKFNWNDLGYLAHLHPLELWVARYLLDHPKATYEEAVMDSAQARHESYSWLVRPHRHREQNTRIRVILEQEAFAEIRKAWARLGFPFNELVPSYATALGSSGDTPDALATLAGIVLNHGVRYPSMRIGKLHFAKDTPYETVLERDVTGAERVMPVDVAAALHEAMLGVVEHGTAFGAYHALTLPDGSFAAIAGKTGTGDNRVERYAPGGAVIESKVRNRTAAFVFTIGDHFFGTLLVYTQEPYAASKSYTSALAVRVFRNLAPSLKPLLVSDVAVEIARK